VRSKLRRLEQAARGHLKSFELVNGSRFYWDPQGAELFLHFCEYLRAHDQPERPEPPEVLKALTQAKDRARALEEVGGWGWDIFPYDKQALVERGEIVPLSVVVGRELGEPLPDLSE
jgi:hypothetical protein